MATKQITTWDEFKTALDEVITETTTYELMNDIDAIDDILESRLPAHTGASNQIHKYFNGNGHKINGITSYITVTLNSSTSLVGVIGGSYSSANNFGNTYFDNVHFTNIQTPNIFLFSAHLHFTNCLFNGIVLALAGNRTSGSNPSIQYPNTGAMFQKCSFNLKCIRSLLWSYYGYMDSNFSFVNCYIIAEESAADFAFTLQDTYYETTKNVSGFITVKQNYFKNSVVNAYLKNTSSAITISSYSGDYNLINSDRLQIDDVTISGSCYSLTDSQLKSKTYIQENTNFPLYG